MGNLIVEKSFQFSVRVVFFCQKLIKNKEYIISRQLFKSATAIGANVEEALAAYSRKDFINKLSIAHKEARESKYWIKLLFRTNYMSEDEYLVFISDCESLIKILFAIIKTSRKS